MSSSIPVVLGRPWDPPTVRGTPKPRLTRAQYDVVMALLEAGVWGLTKDGLDERSGHPEARKILKRLRDSDPE